MKENGLSMQVIVNKLRISRQRVHQLLYPDKLKAYQKDYRKIDKYKAYMKAYRKTDKYKAYQKDYHKHRYHIRINEYFADCKNCIL